MEIKRRHWVLFVLFLTFFITRSLIAAQQDNFGNDTSYYTMRQIEHFSKNWRPLHYDTLSYGGRNFIVMPFYYYLMGFFYKVFPNILFLKILNNFFASTIIFGVYFLSVKILKNTKIALFCSVVASSIPIYLSETMNNLNPYSIVTPLAFFIIALFLELNEKVLNYLIPLTIIFILSSFDSLILVIGIISYIIYVFLENKKLEKKHIEYASFFLLFFIWVVFIIYKEAFQVHGFSVVFFKNNLTMSTINVVGIPLTLFGLYSIYVYSSKKRNVYMTLLISLIVSNFILLILNLVPFNTLIIISMYFVIMMGQTLRDLNIYIQKTKISKHTELIISLIFIFLVISQIMPGFFLYEKGFSEKYIEGFEWIKYNTENDATILSIPEDGHLISYISKRKNAIDNEYLLVNFEKRKSEILEAYKSRFRIPILNFLNEHNIDYIIVSDKLKKYEIDPENTIFLSDPCFEEVYNGEIIIYRKCEN